VRALAATSVSRPENAQSGQKPAKDDGKPDSSRNRTHHGVGKSRRVHTVVWNRHLRGIESPAGDIESISRDFDAAREATDSESSPQRSGVAARAPCLLLNRQCVTKTTKPGNTRLNARYGISAVREECA